MSLNLYLEAYIVTKDKKNRRHKLTDNFELWQTPTEVSHCIMSLPTVEDRARAYSEWVMSDKQDNECELIGEQHIKEVVEWISEHEELDYEIVFFVM